MDGLKVFLAAQADLLRYARRITNDFVEAEDVVQEAWLRFRSTTSTRALDEPNAYLFRIVRNLAFDRQRRRSREDQIFTSGADRLAEIIASDEPTQHRHLVARDELALLRETMAQLPQRTRRAFQMHRFEDMKLVDIAAELGISKSLAQELVIEGVEYCKKALRRSH